MRNLEFRIQHNYASDAWPLVSVMDRALYDMQSRDITRRILFSSGSEIFTWFSFLLIILGVAARFPLESSCERVGPSELVI